MLDEVRHLWFDSAFAAQHFACRISYGCRLSLLHLVIMQCTSRMAQVSDSASSGTVRKSELELFLSNCHRIAPYGVPKSPADRFCFVIRCSAASSLVGARCASLWSGGCCHFFQIIFSVCTAARLPSAQCNKPAIVISMIMLSFANVSVSVAAAVEASAPASFSSNLPPEGAPAINISQPLTLSSLVVNTSTMLRTQSVASCPPGRE